MKKLCALCGINPATTKDHIPPLCLYPRPRDNDINLNTVQACTVCNNTASSDDEVFKVIVGIATGEHQSSQEKVVDSLAATIAGNRKLAATVFSTKQNVYARLNGEVLEPAVAITFDFARYSRVVQRIVKALHWMKTGVALNSRMKINVYPGDRLDKQIASQFSDALMHLPLESLNKGTFSYRGHIDADGCGVWGMEFFGRHTVFAITNLE